LIQLVLPIINVLKLPAISIGESKMIKQKIFVKSTCLFGMLFFLGTNVLLSASESQINTSHINSAHPDNA
jgi:hypothetical protein